MPAPLDAVREALTVFLAGGAFAPLRSAVMDATEIVDADEHLADAERDWFDELYDAVYMAAEDPVRPSDARDGIIGAAALRVQLRELRLDRYGAPPA